MLRWMTGVAKKILLVAAALVALAIIACVGFMLGDQERLQLAANPCERDCLQDSGGLADCRADCASHPLTYGPAAQPPRD